MAIETECFDKQEKHTDFYGYLTLNLLTTTIVAPPSNASKWQVGFNSAFKGLIMKVNFRGDSSKSDVCSVNTCTVF